MSELSLEGGSRPPGAIVAVSGQARPEVALHLSFSIPPADLREFAGLPDEVRTDVGEKLMVLAIAHAAKNKQQVFREHQRNANGWSPKRLCQLYYDFTRGVAAKGFTAGDWRILRNNLKAGADFWTTKEVVGFRPEFINFVKGLFENNQRVCSVAYRALIEAWQTRRIHDARGNLKTLDKIPGYDTWPAADRRTGLPRGWTDSNIARACKLTAFEKLAARQGRMAASAHRLPVKTTRVGLAIGERMEMDDHDYNFDVAMPGLKQLQRPCGFAAVDHLSDAGISSCWKPVAWDLEEQKRIKLSKMDMAWFTINTLSTCGYRTDERGTTLVIEHRVAALDEWLEKNLFDYTGKCVRVHRGGIVRRPAHGGQFEARAKGNFRTKAHVEQFWRMVDDELAALPGQVGKDRDHCPEGHEAEKRYHESLMRVVVEKPDLARRIQWPCLNFSNFVTHALAAFQRINNSRNHKLEGWGKLGFFRRNPETGLSEPLTRGEVWMAGRHELTPLRPEMWPLILGEAFGRPVRMHGDGMITFRDSTADYDTLEFVGDVNGARLAEGNYLGFFNPFATPRKLVVCDAKLRVLGVCAEYARPCANDQAGVNRLLGAQAHDEARQLAPMQARHADDAEALTAMREHNENVKAGLPTTPTERQHFRKQQRESVRLATIAEEAIAAAAPA